MKKIVPFFLSLLISVATFSQQKSDEPVLTKQDYLKKSKAQKTAGLILFGGGAALTVTGLIIGINDAAEEIAGIFAGQADNGSNTGVVRHATTKKFDKIVAENNLKIKNK